MNRLEIKTHWWGQEWVDDDPDNPLNLKFSWRKLWEIRKARNDFPTPTIFDYVLHALGKVYISVMNVQHCAIERMGRATLKIQMYKAHRADSIKQERINREAYHNGGCAK